MPAGRLDITAQLPSVCDRVSGLDQNLTESLGGRPLAALPRQAGNRIITNQVYVARCRPQEAGQLPRLVRAIVYSFDKSILVGNPPPRCFKVFPSRSYYLRQGIGLGRGDQFPPQAVIGGMQGNG